MADVIVKWTVVSSSVARKDFLVRMSRELELLISGTPEVPVSANQIYSSIQDPPVLYELSGNAGVMMLSMISTISHHLESLHP